MHQRAGEDSGDEALFSDEDGGREEELGGRVEDVVSVAMVPWSPWLKLDFQAAEIKFLQGVKN